MICTNCYYQGKLKTETKGSFLIELVLWFFFLVPGIIYSLWRLTTRNKVCAKCGSLLVVPEDSVRGQEILRMVEKADKKWGKSVASNR